MKGTPFHIRRKRPLDRHFTCLACGYDLYGLPVEMTWEHLRNGRSVRCAVYLTGTCPECGASFWLEPWLTLAPSLAAAEAAASGPSPEG